jgi:hypothetical protein
MAERVLETQAGSWTVRYMELDFLLPLYYKS